MTLANEVVTNLQQQQQSAECCSKTGLLTSPWDIRDRVLPQPASEKLFDPFDAWPDGDCRRIYRASTTPSGALREPGEQAAAARHWTGWAMRNTNNHNHMVLKKSCLGLLVCSNPHCHGAVRIRPAICDKARGKQIGKPCRANGCDGKLVLRRCRGNRDFPVTHFWRTVGTTIYFQAKGSHDHPQPALNWADRIVCTATTTGDKPFERSLKRSSSSDERTDDYQVVPDKRIKAEHIRGPVDLLHRTASPPRIAATGGNSCSSGSLALPGHIANTGLEDFTLSDGTDYERFVSFLGSDISKHVDVADQFPTVPDIVTAAAAAHDECPMWRTSGPLTTNVQCGRRRSDGDCDSERKCSFSSSSYYSSSWSNDAAAISPACDDDYPEELPLFPSRSKNCVEMWNAEADTAPHASSTLSSTAAAAMLQQQTDVALLVTSYPSPPPRAGRHYAVNESGRHSTLMTSSIWNGVDGGSGTFYLDDGTRGSRPPPSNDDDLTTATVCCGWSFDEHLDEGLAIMARHAGIDVLQQHTVC